MANKFKIGDKVTILAPHRNAGSETTITSIGQGGDWYGVDQDSLAYPYHNAPEEEQLKLTENTMDDLKNGTIIEQGDEGDGTRLVLAVLGNDVYTMDLYDESGDVNKSKLAELKRDGYYVHGSKPAADEQKEVTLEEVAEAMGIEVKNLRIKDKE